MITVSYKPLADLPPVHIAMLALAEMTLSLGGLERTISLPRMILENAAEDLTAWGLARLGSGALHLSARGARCVAAWVATGRRGQWEVESEGWLLGKGVFSLRGVAGSLSTAGLDQETGAVLAETDATDGWKQYVRAVRSMEEELRLGTFSEQLGTALLSLTDDSKIIGEALAQVKMRLHLNQLERLAEAVLSPGPSDDDAAKEWKAQARGEWHRQRSNTERSLRDELEKVSDCKRVLLAAWLAKREGFLGELAATEPAALLIRSDCDDFSWMEEEQHEDPAERWAGLEELKVDARDREKSGGIVTGLGRLIRSLFGG